jgi:hypothetical protein
VRAESVVHLPGEWPGTITKDARGRLRIYLGRRHRPVDGWRRVEYTRRWRGRGGRWREARRAAWVHPAATSGGWAWLPRFLVWRETGEPPHPSEHCHHEDGDVSGYDPSKISVVLAEYHGRLHATATLIYRLRDPQGRFAPSGETYRIPRYGAIMGKAALQ